MSREEDARGRTGERQLEALEGLLVAESCLRMEQFEVQKALAAAA
jgi:hypothetical protein